MSLSWTLALVDKISGPASTASRAMRGLETNMKSVRGADGRLRDAETGRFTKGLDIMGAVGEVGFGVISKGAEVAMGAVKALGVAFGVAAAAGIGLSVMGAQYAAEMGSFREQTMFALKIVTGTQAEAEKVWSTADHLARSMGMKTSKVADSMRELISGGLDASEAKQVTAMIADVVAMDPSGKANAGELSTFITKMLGQGKVTKELLDPILSRGVSDPAFYKALAEITGKSGKDATQEALLKEISAGKIKATDAVAALKKATYEQGGSKGLGSIAADRANTTGQGAIEALEAQWERLFLSIKSGPAGQAVIGLMSELTEALDPAGAGAGILEAFNAITAGATEVWNKIMPSGGAAGIVQAVTGALTRAVPLVMQMADMGVDLFDRMFGDGNAGAMLSGIMSIFARMVPLVTSFVGGFASGFADALGTVAPLFKALFGAMDLGKGQGAAGVFKAIGQALGFVAVGVVLTVGAIASIIGALASLPALISGGLGFLAVTAVAAIADLTSSLGAVPGDLVGLAMGVGAAIVQGIGAGLTGGIEWIKGVVTSLGTTIVDTVKLVLKIQSPSKVMEGLGSYTAEGFAKGVESGNGNARAATSALVRPPTVTAAGRVGGGGNTYNFSFEIHGDNAEETAAEVRRVVMQVLEEDSLSRAA